MVSDLVGSILQIAHVICNSALFFAFVYQGLLGKRIRSRRTAGILQDFQSVRKHRALGPILAILLAVGYFVGLITAYLNRGTWMRYPGHLAGGTVLLVVAYSAVLVSRRIRGAQSPWRTVHFELGLLLLGVFLAQIFLGLNIFL